MQIQRQVIDYQKSDVQTEEHFKTLQNIIMNQKFVANNPLLKTDSHCFNFRNLLKLQQKKKLLNSQNRTQFFQNLQYQDCDISSQHYHIEDQFTSDNYSEEYKNYILYKSLAIPNIIIQKKPKSINDCNSLLKKQLSIELLCFRIQNEGQFRWVQLNQSTRSSFNQQIHIFKGIKILETSHCHQGQKFFLLIAIYSENNLNQLIPEQLFISQQIQVVSRKKGRIERENLSCFFDPFYGSYLQDMERRDLQNHCDQKQKLFDYVYTQKIYNKSFHPFLFLFKFSQVVDLFYNTNIFNQVRVEDVDFFKNVQKQIFEVIKQENSKNQEQPHQILQLNQEKPKPLLIVLNLRQTDKLFKFFKKLSGPVLNVYSQDQYINKLKNDSRQIQNFQKIEFSEQLIENYCKTSQSMVNIHGNYQTKNMKKQENKQKLQNQYQQNSQELKEIYKNINSQKYYQQQQQTSQNSNSNQNKRKYSELIDKLQQLSNQDQYKILNNKKNHNFVGDDYMNLCAKNVQIRNDYQQQWFDQSSPNSVQQDSYYSLHSSSSALNDPQSTNQSSAIENINSNNVDIKFNFNVCPKQQFCQLYQQQPQQNNGLQQQQFQSIIKQPDSVPYTTNHKILEMIKKQRIQKQQEQYTILMQNEQKLSQIQNQQQNLNQTDFQSTYMQQQQQQNQNK